MLVSNWMTKDVITTGPNTSMQDAVRLMRNNYISMLPVLKKDKIIGVVTDLNIKQASASEATLLSNHEMLAAPALSKIKIKEIMHKEPILAPYDLTIEEVAESMMKHKISGMPVVDLRQRLIGIITQTDVFKALISLIGSDKKGIQFAFLIEDRPGSIKELTDIIREYGGRLLSILTSYDRAPTGYRHLYIRAFAVSRQTLWELKLKLEKRAQLLYMIDHRENIRQVS